MISVFVYDTSTLKFKPIDLFYCKTLHTIYVFGQLRVVRVSTLVSSNVHDQKSLKQGRHELYKSSHFRLRIITSLQIYVFINVHSPSKR